MKSIGIAVDPEEAETKGSSSRVGIGTGTDGEGAIGTVPRVGDAAAAATTTEICNEIPEAGGPTGAIGGGMGIIG